MNHSMTWADFYLICFAVGFCFSFFSFLFGGSRAGRLHLPHFHGHVGGAHLPSASAVAAHGPVVAGHAPVSGATHASATAHAQQDSGVSPFNFVTLTAFLAWFGGTGYLLTRYSGLWVGFGLLASVTSGLIGGSIVFVFGARSDNGTAIAKGTEVVVTRYGKGIAYVRLWSEMSGEE